MRQDALEVPAHDRVVGGDLGVGADVDRLAAGPQQLAAGRLVQHLPREVVDQVGELQGPSDAHLDPPLLALAPLVLLALDPLASGHVLGRGEPRGRRPVVDALRGPPAAGHGVVHLHRGHQPRRRGPGDVVDRLAVGLGPVEGADADRAGLPQDHVGRVVASLAARGRPATAAPRARGRSPRRPRPGRAPWRPTEPLNSAEPTSARRTGADVGAAAEVDLGEPVDQALGHVVAHELDRELAGDPARGLRVAGQVAQVAPGDLTPVGVGVGVAGSPSPVTGPVQCVSGRYDASQRAPHVDRSSR